MLKLMIHGTLAICLIGLAACDKTRSDLPAPQVATGKPYVEKPFAPLPDPSLPAADSALAPATTPTAKDDASTRPNANLTRAEESTAMPKAGQVNNYSSTALDRGKGASAP